MKRLAVLLTVALAGILVTAAPAHAVTARPITWVSTPNGLPSAWPLARAMSFVGRYTGSQLVRGTCQPGARCIIVSESRSLPRGYGAVTYPGPTAYLELNASRRGSSSATRLRIVTHELAHANGIEWHNPSCVSVMYYALTCHGRATPMNFTWSERQVLRRH
jgi:hypothetical protein